MLGKKVKSSGVKKEKELGLGAINAQVGFLLGKVLTIVDASIADARQNKAMKDLVRSAFHGQLDWISELCLGKNWIDQIRVADESEVEELSKEETDNAITGKN